MTKKKNVFFIFKLVKQKNSFKKKNWMVSKKIDQNRMKWLLFFIANDKYL